MNNAEEENNWISRIREEFREEVILLRFALFSIVLFVVSFLLELWIETNPSVLEPKYILICFQLLVHLFNEIGIACIIALGLALTIDRLAKWRFIELAKEDRDTLKKDIFRYIYGYKIPSEITDEIDSQVLRSLFVRKKAKLIYSIKPIFDDEQKFLLVTATFSYDLENLTSAEKDYPFCYFIEKSPSSSLASEVKFEELIIENSKSNDINWNAQQIKDKVSLQQGRLGFNNPIIIQVSPDIPTSVTVKYHMIRLAEGESNFSTLIPTLKLDWKVFLEDDSLELECHVPAQGGIKQGTEYQMTEKLYHWESKRPLLPGQGIYFRWFNKPIE